jgi:hypothetical protein
MIPLQPRCGQGWAAGQKLRLSRRPSLGEHLVRERDVARAPIGVGRLLICLGCGLRVLSTAQRAPPQAASYQS